MKKNVDKCSLRRQAKPTNSFDNFFLMLPKLAQGSSKIAINRYPRYVFPENDTPFTGCGIRDV